MAEERTAGVEEKKKWTMMMAHGAWRGVVEAWHGCIKRGIWERP